MFWHAFIPLTFIILCFKDKKTYFKTMLVYIIGCLIANITFILYQTTITRPELIGNDFLTNLMKLVYGNDNPVNCFPSIHVFTSVLMIRAVRNSNFSNFYTNLTTSTIGYLIILSTVFIKQHTLLDVISGIFIAELLIVVVNRYEDKLLITWNHKLFYKLSLRDIFS
jgi:membrane-associated phospholipid phosphatase